MSLFDFNSIINSYNQPVIQGSNVISDKTKTTSSKDSSNNTDSQKYIEQQRTLAEILSEQGVEATQRNKEIAKALYAYNQMINKATIDYVKKMMAELKFNNEKAYEAYMILFTNSIQISQKNLDSVQRIIQDKNVILEIKEFVSEVDKLTGIIDKAVDDEIAKLEAEKSEAINKSEIESKIIKNLVADLYASVSKNIPEIVESTLNSKVVNKEEISKDLQHNEKSIDQVLDPVKEKTNIVKNLDVQTEVLLDTKEKVSVVKNSEKEVLVSNLKENLSLNIEKSFKETNNALLNTETKVVYEEVKTVENKNFYKITNKNINDFINNKIQVNSLDFSENNLTLNTLNNFVNSESFVDSPKIEGFEYHLRNAGMSDKAKEILKEPLITNQEVKDGESIVHLISKESSVPRASFKLAKLPQETILVNNTPVFVNIDGKPRLVLKDKTGVKILLVNLDMVQKMIGLIKPESARVIVKDGHQLLIFKDDFSSQEKTIPLDSKISVKETLAQPKIVSSFGDKSVLALDNNTGEIHIVPLKYILGTEETQYVGVGFKPTPTDNDMQSTPQNISIQGEPVRGGFMSTLTEHKPTSEKSPLNISKPSISISSDKVSLFLPVAVGVGFMSTPMNREGLKPTPTADNIQPTSITLDKNLFYKIAGKVTNSETKNLNIVNTSDGKVFLLADNKLINPASIIDNPKVFSAESLKLNTNKIVFVKNEPQLLLNIENNNVLVPLPEPASNFIKNNISDIGNINQDSIVSFNPSEKTVKVAIGNNSIEIPFDSSSYFSVANVGASDNYNLQSNTQTTVNKSALATCPLIVNIDGANYVAFANVEQPISDESIAIETPINQNSSAPEAVQVDTKNPSTQAVKPLDTSAKVSVPSILNAINATKATLLPINNIIENLPNIPNLSEHMVNLKKTPFIDNDKVLFVDQNNNTVSLPLPALVGKISELRNNSMNNFFSAVNDKNPQQLFKINDQSFFVSSIKPDGLEVVPSLCTTVLDKNDPKLILIENTQNIAKNLQTNPSKEYILLPQEQDPLLQPLQVEKLQSLSPITTVVINGEGFFIINKADKNKKTSTITEIKALNSENFGSKPSETIKPFNYDNKNIALLNLFGQEPKVADLSIPENHTFLKPFAEPIIDEEGNIIFPDEKNQQIFMLNNSSVKNFKSFAIPEHNIVQNQHEKVMLFKSEGTVFVANLENVKPTNLSTLTTNNYFVGKNQNGESVIYKADGNNELKKIMVESVPKTFFINLAKPTIFNENGNKVLVLSDNGELVKIPVDPSNIDTEVNVTPIKVEVGNKPHLLAKVDGKIVLVSKESLDKNPVSNNVQLSEGNENVFFIKDNGQVKLLKPSNPEIKELKNNEKITVKVGGDLVELVNEKGILKPTKTDAKIPNLNLNEPVEVNLDSKPALIFKDEKGVVKLLKTDNLQESEVKEGSSLVVTDPKGKKVLVSNENGVIKKSSLESAVKQSEKITAPTNFVKDDESFFIIPDKEIGKSVIVKQNFQDTVKPNLGAVKKATELVTVEGKKSLVIVDKGELVKIPVEPSSIDAEVNVNPIKVEVENQPHLLAKVDGKIVLVSKESLDKNPVSNNVQLSNGNENVFVVNDNGKVKLLKPSNPEIKELKNNEKITVKVGSEVVELVNEKGVLKPTKTDAKIPNLNLDEPVKVNIDGKPAVIFKDEKGAVKVLKTDNLQENELKEGSNIIVTDPKGKKVLVSNENGVIKKSSLESAVKQSEKITTPTNFVKDGQSFFVVPNKETGKSAVFSFKPENSTTSTIHSDSDSLVSLPEQKNNTFILNKDNKNILFFYDLNESKYKAADTHNINKFANKIDSAEVFIAQNEEPLIALKNESGKNQFFGKNEIQANSKPLLTPLSINHNDKPSMILPMDEGFFNIPTDKAIKLSKKLSNPFVVKNNDNEAQIIFPKNESTKVEPVSIKSKASFQFDTNKENNHSAVFEVNKSDFGKIRDSKDPVVFDDNTKFAYKEGNQVKVFEFDKNFEKNSKEIANPIKVEHDNKEKILLFKNEKPYLHTIDKEANIKVDKHFHGVMDNKAFTFYPNEKTNNLSFQSTDDINALKKDSTKNILFNDIKTVELVEPLNYSISKPNTAIQNLKNLTTDPSNQNYNDFTKIIKDANELKSTINNMYDNSLIEDPKKFAEKMVLIQQLFGNAEAQIKTIQKDLDPFKSESNEDSEGISDNPITEVLSPSKSKNTKPVIDKDKKKGTDLKMSFESLLKAVLSDMSSKIEKISLNLHARELLASNEKTFAVPLSFPFGDLKLSGEMVVKQEEDKQTKTNLGKTISIKLAVETKNLDVVVLEFTNMEKDLQIAIKVENKKIKAVFDNKLENLNFKLKKSKYYVKPISCSINPNKVRVNSFIIPKNTFPKSLKKIDGII